MRARGRTAAPGTGVRTPALLPAIGTTGLRGPPVRRATLGGALAGRALVPPVRAAALVPAFRPVIAAIRPVPVVPAVRPVVIPVRSLVPALGPVVPALRAAPRTVVPPIALSLPGRAIPVERRPRLPASIRTLTGGLPAIVPLPAARLTTTVVAVPCRTAVPGVPAVAGGRVALRAAIPLVAATGVTGTRAASTTVAAAIGGSAPSRPVRPLVAPRRVVPARTVVLSGTIITARTVGLAATAPLFPPGSTPGPVIAPWPARLTVVRSVTSTELRHLSSNQQNFHRHT